MLRCGCLAILQTTQGALIFNPASSQCSNALISETVFGTNGRWCSFNQIIPAKERVVYNGFQRRQCGTVVSGARLCNAQVAGIARTRPEFPAEPRDRWDQFLCHINQHAGLCLQVDLLTLNDEDLENDSE